MRATQASRTEGKNKMLRKLRIERIKNMGAWRRDPSAETP